MIVAILATLKYEKTTKGGWPKMQNSGDFFPHRGNSW